MTVRETREAFVFQEDEIFDDEKSVELEYQNNVPSSLFVLLNMNWSFEFRTLDKSRKLEAACVSYEVGTC
jgi:hypothetical protein